MTMLTIDLKIVMETALTISTGRPDDGATSPFMRDMRGRVCLPSTTLKGAHRDATEKIASAFGLAVCNAPQPLEMCHPLNGQSPCVVCQIFGSSWVQGRVFYRDLVSMATPTEIEVTRSPQSRRRRVKLDSDKRVFEGVPSGTTFDGSVQHLINDKGLLGLAVVALGSIRHIGAGRGMGIGLCVVQARALDSLKQPISERELAEALQQLKQSGQSNQLRKL